MKKLTAMLLALILALSLTACASAGDTEESTGTPPAEPAAVLGEGGTVFDFAVTDLEGNTTLFEIHTDKTIVGDALEELGLIQGDEGPYGLTVETVNGITADWDTDQAYWALYVDGEYALTGVDQTEIAEGSAYSMVLTQYS